MIFRCERISGAEYLMRGPPLSGGKALPLSRWRPAYAATDDHRPVRPPAPADQPIGAGHPDAGDRADRYQPRPGWLADGVATVDHLGPPRADRAPAPDNFQRFDALSLKGSGHSLSQDDGHDLGRKGRYSKLAGGSRHRLNGDIENDAAMSLFVNYDLCEIGLHGGQLHIACSTNRTASTASTAPTTRRSAV